MRYLIKTQEQDDLEDLVEDEELTLVHRYKHVPYTSFESPLAYEQITARHPDYEITQDKHYDTQHPPKNPGQEE